jgi:hypothetical protein
LATWKALHLLVITAAALSAGIGAACAADMPATTSSKGTPCKGPLCKQTSVGMQRKNGTAPAPAIHHPPPPDDVGWDLNTGNTAVSESYRRP